MLCRLSALALLATVLATASTPTPAQSYPELDGLEPGVAAFVGEYLTQFEQQRSELSGVELGKAYGFVGMVLQANDLLYPAVDRLRRARELDRDNYLWPYLEAVALADQGDCTSALEQYRRAAALFPDYPALMYRQARCLLRVGSLDEAKALLVDVLAQRPGQSAALAALAEIAMLEDDPGEASALLEEALSHQPAATQLYHPLAAGYRAEGRMDDARAALRKAGNVGPVIEDPVLGRLVALKAGNEHLAQAGVQAIENGRYEEAVQTLGQALQRRPEDHAARTNLARALELSGDLDASLRHLDTVVAAQPDNGIARFNRAAVHEQRGDDEPALADYRAAFAADSSDLLRRYYLANALLRNGQYQEAYEHYAELVRREPDGVLYRYLRGVTEAQTGRCEAAPTTLDPSQVDAEPARALLTLPYVKAVAVCAPSGDPRIEQASALAQRRYQAAPDVYAAEALAMISAAAGRSREALDYATQAVFEAAKSRPEAMQAYADLRRLVEEGKPLRFQLDPDDPVYAPRRITATVR